MVCGDCAPKPGKYAGQEPKSFVGKLVKIGFDAKRLDGSDTKEHMWVQVQQAVAGEWLKGKLLNTPYFTSKFGKGDEVGFRVSEVEDIAPEPPKVHFPEN